MGDEHDKYTQEEDDRVRFQSILERSIRILETSGIPYLAAGSLPMEVIGRSGQSADDVDLLVKRDDLRRALEALEADGYELEPTEHEWLAKAVKDNVLVDLIIEAGDAIYVDDEMLRRGFDARVKGVDARIIGPEDFVVMQALATKRDAPEYWFNGVEVLQESDVDWEYLVRRARVRPARVAALLAYGRSEGVDVPQDVLTRLLAPEA